MNTKYVKVSVSERPENDERYFAWIDNPNADSYIDPDNYNRTTITAINGEFKSFYNVTHYLKEVPDHSEEMEEMLNEIFLELDSLWDHEHNNSVFGVIDVKKIAELLNKVKDNGTK
ncbi:hypothetical protein [Elizabethkingia meningoseptica]|uniref:hypothetical protein n=1 Tax=Elizabethkingia meningoseptica TaxID=238 RepID=UPI003891E183